MAAEQNQPVHQYRLGKSSEPSGSTRTTTVAAPTPWRLLGFPRPIAWGAKARAKHHGNGVSLRSRPASTAHRDETMVRSLDTACPKASVS